MEATECINSSEILSYAEMIDKYGPITVIIGVFIVILLITFTIIIKMMHNSNSHKNSKNNTYIVERIYLSTIYEFV